MKKREEKKPRAGAAQRINLNYKFHRTMDPERGQRANTCPGLERGKRPGLHEREDVSTQFICPLYARQTNHSHRHSEIFFVSISECIISRENVIY